MFAEGLINFVDFTDGWEIISLMTSCKLLLYNLNVPTNHVKFTIKGFAKLFGANIRELFIVKYKMQSFILKIT